MLKPISNLFSYSQPPFVDRRHAGQALARELEPILTKPATIFALPRGGVPVGYEIAKHFSLPLNLLVARKLPSPDNPEFGIGAIAQPNTIIFDSNTLKRLNLRPKDLLAIIETQQEALNRRIELYRPYQSLPEDLTGQTALIVDDGIATGVTIRAALRSISLFNPRSIILAAPVCASNVASRLHADNLVCHLTPKNLSSIGQYYQNFPQLSDQEVLHLLDLANELSVQN